MTEPASVAEERRSTVLVSDVDGIRVLTLNRPERRNAVDDRLRDELHGELLRAETDPSVRGIVLTGAGIAFCAGGDIKAMAQRLNDGLAAGEIAADGWRRQRKIHALVRTLHGLPKPTVAAINGPAVGLGADLALSCDFIIASAEASIATNFVLRGLVPDGGGAYFLPRRVGLSRAKSLIYSGRTVLPDEALAIGLVDDVVASADLVGQACQLARESSQGSALALGLAKSLLDHSSEHGLDATLTNTAQAQAMCYTSSEHRAMVEAFVRPLAQER